MAKPEAELKKAIKKGDSDRVKQVLDEGLPVDAELPGKVTALECALATEQREIVWELLRRGAKPRRKKNDNLLIDVPKFRDIELMRRLVELGADVNDGDKEGFTPLLSAAIAGFFDGFQYLLEQGADPFARHRGDSVLQLVEQSRRPCNDLCEGPDDEYYEMFQTQLADLDRIEQLLESTLTAEQIKKLRSDLPAEPEPSTFWDLHDLVGVEIEIAPFLFTANCKSRIKLRLGHCAGRWHKHFQNDGKVLVRVSAQRGEGSWLPLTLDARDGRWLLFSTKTQLPSGEVNVEVHIDADREEFASHKLDPWPINVDA